MAQERVVTAALGHLKRTAAIRSFADEDQFTVVSLACTADLNRATRARPSEWQVPSEHDPGFDSRDPSCEGIPRLLSRRTATSRAARRDGCRKTRSIPASWPTRANAVPCSVGRTFVPHSLNAPVCLSSEDNPRLIDVMRPGRSSA